MNIPQVRLFLDDREKQAVLSCLNSGWLSEGPQCAKFHDALLELTGAPYGVFAPNGTLALVLALMALEIGPGDEVIVPDCTFVASANAVVMVGARPVFCDVKSNTFQIDVASAERVLTGNTRAVMPVHLFGSCADMGAVVRFAREYDLFIIEDAAQAVGVRGWGRHAGTFGHCGCFSFFCDKTLTTGEGGFVVCQDESIYERLMRLRCHGRLRSGSFVHTEIGWNFRITDLQGALGVAQMSKLKDTIALKRICLEGYQQELCDVKQVEFVATEEGSEHVPFRCVLLVEDREWLMERLRFYGIEPRTFFHPLHKQPCFEYLCQTNDTGFPRAMRGWQHGLLLPCYPTLTREEVAYIGERIREFYA